MAIKAYLAMTAAEFYNASHLPREMAWMACHFSPYGTGLSNLPRELPEGAVLIVNDITPIHNHDPETIIRQLSQCIEAFRCSAVLLDFQRLPNDETEDLAQHLLQALPCPTVMTENLAWDFDCPILLPPCPLYRPLQTHIQKYMEREIWLEISAEQTDITLYQDHNTIASLPGKEIAAEGFEDAFLHCHYGMEVTSEAIKFHLWRTKEDQAAFLNHAQELGISAVVGLYQEFETSL